MDQVNIIQSALDKPLFDPTFINIEYFFDKIVEYGTPVINFIMDPHTWNTVGVISILSSVLCFAIIIFAVVRIYEIQQLNNKNVDDKINEAVLFDKEKDRNENMKWKYILTLVESPNESDWKMAIIEADSLLEESLRKNGVFGDTMSELLDSAKSNGYSYVQNAWDAHIVRNKIAHQGSDFPVTQVEARRTIKLYQNFFEEIKVI